ncbi:hypothetical protein [Entomospira culicis]|uniref:Uncharacterized protein n=1 Tax=Entomospira culicis TaxID=2719989 RepID=A0A968GIM0_9SPIO|nr:hypothetical protein [Entomospira culicis]NIZ19131.1 hypothetical protein [Entomospira culicis]NIZ69345.1 hypothetical protein [Entomospira culicis]WDI37931.1 hypothetical protein PVA46_03845 [Entomospira culicis]WDI39558.1 hypothetical protein PVA47_03845 [Entomospira culicis]
MTPKQKIIQAILLSLFGLWLLFTLYLTFDLYYIYHGTRLSGLVVGFNEQLYRRYQKGELPIEPQERGFASYDYGPYNLVVQEKSNKFGETLVTEFYRFARVSKQKHCVVVETPTEYYLVDSKERTAKSLTPKQVSAMNLTFSYPRAALKYNQGPELFVTILSVLAYTLFSILFILILRLLFTRNVAKSEGNKKST